MVNANFAMNGETKEGNCHRKMEGEFIMMGASIPDKRAWQWSVISCGSIMAAAHKESSSAMEISSSLCQSICMW